MTPPSTTANTNAAKEVISYCTKCKMDLNHVIIAMQGDRIAKVQCRTCKGEHKFKAPTGATEPVKKKRASKAKDKDGAGEPKTIEVEWERLMSAHKDQPFKKYNAKGQFVLGDKLNHPTFGEGIVGKLIYPNKLEVIFKSDIKVLIHAGG